MSSPRSPERSARVGVLDTDSGFVQVLAKRLDATGLAYRLIAAPPSVEALVALRLAALIVDPAVLGPSAWMYLETVCSRLPHLGLIVCTAPAAVAQRVRGLRLGADDWVTKPCHPEEVVARLEAVVRRRARTARASRGLGRGSACDTTTVGAPGRRRGRRSQLANTPATMRGKCGMKAGPVAELLPVGFAQGRSRACAD